MKKLLFLAVLSLAGMGLGTGQAKAWFLSHWLLCKSCNKCCDGTICLKQYNAFSPVASGSLVVDGCLPIFANHGGPWPGYAGCGPQGCGAEGVAYGAPLAPGQSLPADLGAPQGAPVQGAPGAGVPQGTEPPVFTPPTPMPLPAANPAARMGRPGMIQMAGYRPMYPGYGYPGYGYPGYGYPGYGYPAYGYPGYGYPGYGYPGYGMPAQPYQGPMVPMAGGQ